VFISENTVFFFSHFNAILYLETAILPHLETCTDPEYAPHHCSPFSPDFSPIFSAILLLFFI